MQNSFILQYIDGVPYKMKEPFDFGFLSRYGKVFRVFDDQDSGNICFGTVKDGEKYFVKFAGAPTEAYTGTQEDAIERLRSTVPVYEKLRHEKLIEFVRAEEIAGGFAMIFKWADGDCMGRMYPAEHRTFMQMPVEERMIVFCDVLDFLAYVAASGYVAVDFYDGSVMYDPDKHCTTICDIDFFRNMPCVNDMGRMWGSSHFQAPEEYQLGAEIDECTNVYTAGAMAFALFGNYEHTREAWELSDERFEVAKKAVSDNREDRYQTIKELAEAWERTARATDEKIKKNV
ncbi:MAG: serine/threonine protein kinase [Lachnospiraceae bacterium]|nr:serine/threonine protein kinase [Lachnospiraceae bacterium]